MPVNYKSIARKVHQQTGQPKDTVEWEIWAFEKDPKMREFARLKRTLYNLSWTDAWVEVYLEHGERWRNQARNP